MSTKVPGQVLDAVFDEAKRSIRVDTAGAASSVAKVIEISTLSDGRETWKYFSDLAKTTEINGRRITFPVGYSSGFSGDIIFGDII